MRMKAIARILIIISVLFPLSAFPLILINHGNITAGQFTSIVSIFITLMTFALATYNGSLAEESGRSWIPWLIFSILLIPPLAAIFFLFYLRNQKAAFQLEHLKVLSEPRS
jgi:hypothetical protein